MARMKSLLTLTVLLWALLIVSILMPAVAAVPLDFTSLLMYGTFTPCFSKRAEINCVDKEPAILHPYWMSRLSGDLRLDQIAIPGTHQSASLHGGFAVECQVWDIGEQLRAGIRFLDIRIKLDSSTSLQLAKSPTTKKKGIASTVEEGVIGIYHGPIYQFVSFEEALGVVRQFLQEYPREAVLMKVNEEVYTDDRGQPGFFHELARVLDANADILWCCDYIPLLGNIRGKVLIIRRYGDFPRYGMGLDVFRVQNIWDVPTLWHLDTKMDKFQRLMTNITKSGLPIINYASASGWAAQPFMVARKMNTFVLDLLEDRCSPQDVGIIPMDFPGYGIIQLIIDQNFCNESKKLGPKDYGSCRSQWGAASFTCEVTRNRCALGHSVIQAWRSWSCKCACVSDSDPGDKGCNTVREKWCE